MNFTPTPCDVCGQRPGTIGMLVNDRGRRVTAAVCETCAQQISGQMAAAQPGGPRGERRSHSDTPALDEFGRDLTEEARHGRIDPVIGRDDEIEQAVEVLARRRKNNVVLIGEAGVGKTAIAEGLALRIADGDVPESLEDCRIVALDLTGMVAGSSLRGQFEQRLKSVLGEVVASEGRILVFVDELHTILGAGGAEGAMDAANMLKPMLARGELRMIGATTLAEFRRVERHAALPRRFSPVMVEAPTVEETVEILRGLRPAYEEHHGLGIADAALEAAARLSDRYVTEQHLPDKAIDLMDQAAAKLRLASAPAGTAERLREQLEEAIASEDYERAAGLKRQLDEQDDDAQPAGRATVDETAVAAVVPARPGNPVGELVAGEVERLQQLEDELHERVVGQDEAVEKVADTVRRARVGLSESDRPVGSFLFLGPTGVGKTELVKALAERLFGSEDALVRVDMSEYREAHTVARLIGSPPGYVGYGDGGQLTEPVRRRPYSVVLLDEVEKAHPEVWNVLLQVMDDGRLTDGEGRTVDFTNAIVVMTSNLGAGKAKRGIGFTAGEPAAQEERMLSAAKSAFLPEFLNRIDEIVTFQPLSAEQVEEIATLICGRVADRLRAERGIELAVDGALVERLAHDGFDAELAARPLQRHVRRTLEKALTRAILAGEITDADRVEAACDADGGIVLDTIRPLALAHAA